MQADAAMHPHDERQRELSQDARPVAGVERAQHPEVAGLNVVERLREPRAHDMDHTQRHDRHAEDPLCPFPARQFQRAPPVQRPQCEKEVPEHGLADGIAPHEGEPCPACFEDAQRDQPERMIEEMGDDVGEEDVAGPKAKPSDHDVISAAAGPPRAAGRSWPAHPSRRSDAAGERDAWRSRLRSRPW